MSVPRVMERIGKSSDLVAIVTRSDVYIGNQINLIYSTRSNEMDDNELDKLRQIAVGAMTGYWPAHLGLNNDAERVDWLARKLEAVIDSHADLAESYDNAEGQAGDLRHEVAELESQVAELQLKAGA